MERSGVFAACLLGLLAACLPLTPAPLTTTTPPLQPVGARLIRSGSWQGLRDGWMNFKPGDLPTTPAPGSLDEAGALDESWSELLIGSNPIGFSPDGALWTQVPGRGLVRYDGSQISVPFQDEALVQGELQCHIDSYRDIWCIQDSVPTAQVTYYTSSRIYGTRFELSQAFIDFALDPLGNFWTASEDGYIAELDPFGSGNITLWTSEKMPGLVWAPLKRIRIGARLGDMVLKPVQIEANSQGRILVLTEIGGLYEFDGSAWRESGLIGQGYSAAKMRFTLSPDDEVWVASSHDLLKYDGTVWTHFSNNELDATGLLAAADGTLWLTSYNSGVFSFDGETWQHYTASDRLPSDQITTILSSPDGAVWFFSDAGWARYKPQ